MAADGSPEWVSSLPWAWGYGISAGGRVFFINEEAKSTTWLHPVSGETILTGHRRTPDLPTGWEEAYTFEGARYYINHNERKVTCKHPVTGRPSQDNCIFVVNDQPSSAMTSQETKDRAVSVTSDSSNCNLQPPAANPASPTTRVSRSSGKVHNFGKRSNSIKRNPNAPVTLRGWLYKKANSGMKLWKKRWFVLCDLCLFYYRDEKEEGVLGSILLPSFLISAVTPDDHINRSHAFKAAHPNMRTYFFCTDTGKEMELWMRAMTGASLVTSEPAKREPALKAEYVAPQEINHVANHKLLVRPEPLHNNQRNRELSARLEERALREAERYGFQKDGQERPLTKINSVRLQAYDPAHYKPLLINGPESHASETDSRPDHRAYTPHVEPEHVIQRTSSMQQLEQWIRSQRDKSPEEESAGVLSYQTLPRNMPSYRAPAVPRYPEGYKTLPRNLKTRPDSVCSVSGMGYERAMVPVSATTEEKRRSIRDDTMWQLYEWQQRQFYNKQTTLRRHSSLTSPKTMVHISEQTLHSIPLSPSHGSISGYHTYSPHRAYRSELSSPVQRGDLTIERRAKPHTNMLGLVPDRRSVPAGLALQPDTPPALQGKTMTPEECRPSAYKHRSEEADVDTKLSQLCEQDKIVEALEQKLQQLHKEKFTLEQALVSASQEIELSAEDPSAIQNVVLQRDELQSGLLSTCREVSRATAELERSWRDYDKLEREVTSARNQLRERLERLGEVQTESAGIQRAQMQKEIWRIQDVMEGLSKHKQQRPSGAADSSLLSSGKNTSEEEELVPPRPPLPRSYDFSDPAPVVPPIPSDSSSSLLCYSRGPVHLPDDKTSHHVYQRNGSYNGPDYRLYKSEPELTTVAEVDESTDDKTDLNLDIEASASKGSHFPVGVVPPRTKSPPMESTTIASYVTLRKSRKPESKSERPRSAVEHLCIAESPRPRMTLEEQLERMRRHQAACLKEKKKGLAFLGSADQSPSLSPSFSRENSIKLNQVRQTAPGDAVQVRKREENTVSAPTHRAENTQSPAQEANNPNQSGDQESPVKPADPAASSPADAKDDVTEEPGPTQPELQEQCLQVVNSVLRRNAESQETPGAEKRSEIIFYEFSADTLRRHAGLEEPPSLSVAAAQSQLTEGSHFMCV